MQIYKDYFYTKSTDINLVQVKNTCYSIEKFLKTKLTDSQHFDAQSQLNNGIFSKYNFFHIPLPGVSQVYKSIKDLFRSIVPEGEFFIQCWMNIYKTGQFIDWHEHWPAYANSWHGFLCVDCEPSKTSYIIKNEDSIIDIPSKNGTIVLSKSGEDLHRTWPWEFDTRDRITIAFDIVPVEFIDLEYWQDNWVPL